MVEILRSWMPKILDNMPLLPEQASTVAGEVDLLTFVWVAVSFLAGTPIIIAMGYLMVRYQRKSTTETGGP